MDLEVVCSDTPGTLANITAIIFNEGYNIKSFKGQESSGSRFQVNFTVQGDPRRINLMRNAIRQLSETTQCNVVPTSGSPDSPTLSWDGLTQA